MLLTLSYINPFIDINECQQNVCHVNATCINVRGSYKCICRIILGVDQDTARVSKANE